MKIDLSEKHCKDVLDREIMIGRDAAKDGKRKQFGFNAWRNEYYVTHDNVIVDCGQAVEELLCVYNEL